eukprot:TRINITY_DN8555_c0_g1_i1.p1 TRINITY_DN8555_c0_g1~~TRINITY_DN8555_c0_g1_i1.p1  ORF type:complete len:505 (+),score=55.27 TRINITY_DN8555_c0_g1_i1:369-1883(+)
MVLKHLGGAEMTVTYRDVFDALTVGNFIGDISTDRVTGVQENAYLDMLHQTDIEWHFKVHHSVNFELGRLQEIFLTFTDGASLGKMLPGNMRNADYCRSLGGYMNMKARINGGTLYDYGTTQHTGNGNSGRDILEALNCPVEQRLLVTPSGAYSGALHLFYQFSTCNAPYYCDHRCDPSCATTSNADDSGYQVIEVFAKSLKPVDVVPKKGSVENPALNCVEIQESRQPSGVYYLRNELPSGLPVQAYCNNEIWGGGWTLSHAYSGTDELTRADIRAGSGVNSMVAPAYESRRGGTGAGFQHYGSTNMDWLRVVTVMHPSDDFMNAPRSPFQSMIRVVTTKGASMESTSTVLSAPGCESINGEAHGYGRHAYTRKELYFGYTTHKSCVGSCEFGHHSLYYDDVSDPVVQHADCSGMPALKLMDPDTGTAYVNSYEFTVTSANFNFTMPERFMNHPFGRYSYKEGTTCQNSVRSPFYPLTNLCTQLASNFYNVEDFYVRPATEHL